MPIEDNGHYVCGNLYEDVQVTSFDDFTWEFRPDQEAPNFRPGYVQDIITGKRQIIQCQPRSLSPSPPVQTPIQGISSRRKQSSTKRVAAL